MSIPRDMGRRRSKECAAKDAAREAADDLLLQDAFDHGKPILGICYGLQSLNVWRQGTLIQDLPHVCRGPTAVRQRPRSSTINLGGRCRMLTRYW